VPVTAALSVASTVKLTVVDAPLGVPLITPVLVFSDAHDGSDPTEIDHVYGGVPPLAVRVWL
jgi:hypothetical protein